MVIHELARLTGVSAKTIRYYESIGLLPPPKRGKNNYRQYTPTDIERLQLVASARGIGLSLDDISEILAARRNGIAPCQRVLDSIAERLREIDQSIAYLTAQRGILEQLYDEGQTLPLDDLQGKRCVCYLIKSLNSPT